MIDRDVIAETLHEALRNGGEFAEVFAEDRRSQAASLDDGNVEELTSGRRRGAGVRVIVGETTGFAYTADLSAAGLRDAAHAAAAVAHGGAPRAAVELSAAPSAGEMGVTVPPETIDKARKVELLRIADAAARDEGDAIRQVGASYAEGTRRILVANSDGRFATDERTRTRFVVQCVAVGDTGIQTASEGPGRSMGFEFFDHVDPADVARTAAQRALTMLTARPAPSGPIPVVLQRGAGGVMFHEACGHGLEADLVKKDASVFAGKVGTQVAGPMVTFIDDGTMIDEWGTAVIDDEGAPTRRNTLIENGVLTDYMWDLVRARQAGRAPSGNGRRETYQDLPMVRMTNTFIAAGTDDPEAIIADTEYGIYCVQLGGGQVNTATGDFVFGISEAYLIEGGNVTAPIRAANLIGNGPAALLAVDAVGNDFATWTGTCGKDGQGVSVSAGQPTLRVAELTLGGTAA